MDSLQQMRDLADCCASTFAFPFEATRSSAIGRDPHRYHLQPAAPEELSGQGEFASNHLPVIDQAMTPEQRHRVHAAYSEFGQQFSEWWGQDRTRFATSEQLDDGTTVRLADEYLDIFDTSDGIRCYHWGMRQLFQMPPGWDRIISMVREMGCFKPSEFVKRFTPPAVGEQLLEQMTEHSILLRQD
jgi:hypothetical protein